MVVADTLKQQDLLRSNMAKIIQPGKELDTATALVRLLYSNNDTESTIEAIELLQSHSPHKLAKILYIAFSLVEVEHLKTLTAKNTIKSSN